MKQDERNQKLAEWKEEIKWIEQKYKKKEPSETWKPRDKSRNDKDKQNSSYTNGGVSSSNVSPVVKKPSSKHRPVPEREKNEFGIQGKQKNAIQRVQPSKQQAKEPNI